MMLYLIDNLLPNLYLSVADRESQTCWRVFVGPGFVPTSPAFMRSSTTIHRVGMTGSPKNENGTPIAGGGSVRYNLYSVCHTTVTAATACRLCRLEPGVPSDHGVSLCGCAYYVVR